MKRVIIGIAMAVCFTLGFTICVSGKYPAPGSMPGMTVEKAFASEVNPDPLPSGGKYAPDDALFSWQTFLYLSAAVIGIVAFRRNHY